MTIEELRKMIDAYHTEWCEHLENMDEYSKEYDEQKGEISGLEFVLDLIDGKYSRIAIS